MGLHQYIGARYVPLFYQNSLDPSSCEWEPNVTYEPLTVVTLPNNHCYISKMTVPDTIGTPASNADYWLETGNFNAYIQNLQDQIDIIDVDLDNAQEDILKLEDIKNKKILFVGDSYAAVNGFYFERTCTRLGITDYSNLAVSGTGFTRGSGSNGFLAQIQGYTGDKNSIDLIVVGGGPNDALLGLAGVNTIMSGIANFANYAKVNYPNAKIIVVFAGNVLGTFTNEAGTVNSEDMRIAKFAYQAGCDDKGIEFWDISKALKVGKIMMSNDGLHPSDSGQTELARALSSVLLGAPYVPMFPSSTIDASGGSDWMTGYTPAVNYTIVDDKLILETSDSNYTSNIVLYPNSTTTITGTTFLEMLTFTRIWINEQYMYLPAIYEQYNSKTRITGFIFIHFNGNKMEIASANFDGDNTSANMVPISGAVKRILLPQRIEIPLSLSN